MPSDDETRVGHTIHDHVDTDIGRAPAPDDWSDEKKHMNNTPVEEPGWIGNPYQMDDGYSREEAVELFRRDFYERIENDERFRRAVEALRGDLLGCWCRREHEDEPACHGDVIVAYLESDQTSLDAFSASGEHDAE